MKYFKLTTQNLTIGSLKSVTAKALQLQSFKMKNNLKKYPLIQLINLQLKCLTLYMVCNLKVKTVKIQKLKN